MTNCDKEEPVGLAFPGKNTEYFSRLLFDFFFLLVGPVF